jgi:hypothetical protein
MGRNRKQSLYGLLEGRCVVRVVGCSHAGHAVRGAGAGARGGKGASAVWAEVKYAENHLAEVRARGVEKRQA